MDRAAFLNRMRIGRGEWEALLDEVGEARMADPGVAGAWSVKDIVAHVTDYERWTAGQLEAHVRGEAPPPDPLGMPADMHERNAFMYEASRDRPLTTVLAEAPRVFTRLLTAVGALTEVDLMTPGRIASLGDQESPWEVIAGNSYDHYGEHSPSIRAWLDRTGAA